jgi:hypothetical protein
VHDFRAEDRGEHGAGRLPAEAPGAVPPATAGPTGIRDAFIAEPALKPVEGNTNRYVACVRFTPKDENGQYSGSKELAGIYHAGQLMHLISATPELCRGAPYQPFPELQKLCREIRCPA